MKGIKQADKIHSVWYNDKTELLRDMVHQTSQRESLADGLTRWLTKGCLVDRIT